MTKRPNIVLVVVDSLRYDRCGFGGHNPRLMPNMVAMAQKGAVFHSFFSAGCPTQVAMPALFTSSLPLDYGGYDTGISRRPVTVTECLQNAGYRTVGITAGPDTAPQFGYGRGFNSYYQMVDMHHWFGGMYVRWLWEHVESWVAGDASDSAMRDLIEGGYARILNGALEIMDHMDRIGAPEGWRRRSTIREAVLKERVLMGADPLAVVEKIAKLRRHLDLGFGHPRLTPHLKARVDGYEHLERTANRKLNLMTRRRCSNRAALVNRYLRRELSRTDGNKPLFLYLHYLDVHESKFLIPQMSLERLARLPRDVTRHLARRNRWRQGGRLYDLGTSYVDQHLGGVFAMMKRAGLHENTIYVFTADHGLAVGSHRRDIGSDLSREFYDDYLHIPLVISGPGVEARDVDTLVSSIDLAPTLLEFAGVQAPSQFSGRSLLARLDAPQEFVRAENTGKGRCDLNTKPIYLCFRSDDLKVMYEAVWDQPVEREVYDLAADHEERTNLRDTGLHQDVRQMFLDIAGERVRAVRPRSGVVAGAARHDRRAAPS